MKTIDLSPKARETYGKARVDLGLAIIKSLFLIVLTAPIALILAEAFKNTGDVVGSIDLFVNMPFKVITLLLALYFMAACFAMWFMSSGLKHIHKSEDEYNKPLKGDREKAAAL